MKALLDEQLPARLAEALRERGLDVDAIVERRGMRGMRDEPILETAATEGRAVVTNNVKDFRPLAAGRLAEGKGHAGLILVPSARSRSLSAIGALANGVEAIMRANPEGLADSERWVPPTD